MGAPDCLRYSRRMSHSSTYFTRIFPCSINEEVVGGNHDVCFSLDGSNYRPPFACKLQGFVKFQTVQDAAVCGGYGCLSVCLSVRLSVCVCLSPCACVCLRPRKSYQCLNL